MRDRAMPPLTNRLHSLVGRLSQEGGYIVAQADVAEAVARIVRLERALGELLSHRGGRLRRDTVSVSISRASAGCRMPGKFMRQTPGMA